MATDSKTLNGVSFTPAQRGLNFNEVLRRESVAITKGKEVFDLRDDVSTEIIIRVAMAGVLDQRWKEVAERLDTEHASVADIRRAMTEVLGEVQAEWREICTGIFQNTYPDWTEEDTAKRFTMDQQRRIAELFFTLRMRGSQPPASATSSASDPVDKLDAALEKAEAALDEADVAAEEAMRKIRGHR